MTWPKYYYWPLITIVDVSDDNHLNMTKTYKCLKRGLQTKYDEYLIYTTMRKYHMPTKISHIYLFSQFSIDIHPDLISNSTKQFQNTAKLHQEKGGGEKVVLRKYVGRGGSGWGGRARRNVVRPAAVSRQQGSHVPRETETITTEFTLSRSQTFKLLTSGRGKEDGGGGGKGRSDATLTRHVLRLPPILLTYLRIARHIGHTPCCC